MAHFYGSITGQRGHATRLGSKQSSLEVVAASWQGAVKVELHHHEATGQDMALVSLIPWQGGGVSKVLYCGPVGTYEPTPDMPASSLVLGSTPCYHCGERDQHAVDCQWNITEGR